jgi:thiol-disulfide isomerase/thioredoxin
MSLLFFILTLLSWNVVNPFEPLSLWSNSLRHKTSFDMCARSQESMIRRISGWENYETLVCSDTSELKVVKFASKYCRGCRAIEKKFINLASCHPTFQFYEVEAIEDEEICQREKIYMIPTAVVYFQGKQINKRSCDIRNFDDFASQIQSYASWMTI